jgi:hypothetical protein
MLIIFVYNSLRAVLAGSVGVVVQDVAVSHNKGKACLGVKNPF